MMNLLRCLRSKLLNPVIAQMEINSNILSRQISSVNDTLKSLCETFNQTFKDNVGETPLVSENLTIDENLSISERNQQDEAFYSSIVDAHRKKFGIHIGITDPKLISSICRPTDILRFSRWVEELGIFDSRDSSYKGIGDIGYTRDSSYDRASEWINVFCRKVWEWLFIVQALYERGMLSSGKKGLGFAVGTESLPALFAKYGCRITATDLHPNEGGELWDANNEHSDNVQMLFKSGICDEAIFYKNVNFNYMNMNNISDKLKDFDFCWSSCAFEHLGSLQKGKDFIYNMLNCLKPGGTAVHTTEFNLQSNDDTIVKGSSVIFRVCDFREMRDSLTSNGHIVEPLDFRLDGSRFDDIVCFPPYGQNPHFKLLIDKYLSTSFGLIIQKAM
jgi:hypothetical protein